MSKKIALSSLLLALAIAASARAESYLTPYAGVAFAGRTDDSKLTFGGDLAFTGHLFGVSLDVGYTKDFFGNEPPISSNNITTLMSNVMFLTPGHPRLYVSAGVGLMKTRVQSVNGLFDVNSSDFGFNVGGGIYVVGQGPLGFRADIRYFRTLSDPQPDGEFDLNLGNLDYWRATGGITIKF